MKNDILKLNEKNVRSKIKTPIFESIIEIIENDSQNAELLITPIEKNFSSTLGNLLRRTILSMTPGCAITSIFIENEDRQRIHEFSHIPGMKENINEFIQNLISAPIAMNHYGPRFLFLKKHGPSVVTLGDFVSSSDITISNPNQYLCTINEDAYIDLKMLVESGIGFKPNTQFSHKKLNSNEIKINSIFSPVTHVCYHIKHYTFYEELILHVQTDGSVPPIQVVESAFSTLLTKLTSLRQFADTK